MVRVLTDQLLSVERDGSAFVIAPRRAASSLAEPNLAVETADILTELKRVTAPQVVVDFAAAPYFGASMLETMRALSGYVQTAQGRMVLCNVPPIGKEVLEVTRYHDRWPMLSSRDEALRAVHEVLA